MSDLVRVLIVGAGSRGHAYASAISKSSFACVAAVAEPTAFKRRELGHKYIWKDSEPQVGQEFVDWQDFLEYERERRKLCDGEAIGDVARSAVDAVFICILDEQHADAIRGLQELRLHVMCEKPLATNLNDCLDIYKALTDGGAANQAAVFGIGHVLHYSPHNMLLRQLVQEDEVVGQVISMEHTEPVGWWHFSHSYVR